MTQPTLLFPDYVWYGILSAIGFLILVALVLIISKKDLSVFILKVSVTLWGAFVLAVLLFIYYAPLNITVCHFLSSHTMTITLALLFGWIIEKFSYLRNNLNMDTAFETNQN